MGRRPIFCCLLLLLSSPPPLRAAVPRPVELVLFSEFFVENKTFANATTLDQLARLKMKIQLDLR